MSCTAEHVRRVSYFDPRLRDSDECRLRGCSAAGPDCVKYPTKYALHAIQHGTSSPGAAHSKLGSQAVMAGDELVLATIMVKAALRIKDHAPLYQACCKLARPKETKRSG